jgi:hypothetical protein
MNDQVVDDWHNDPELVRSDDDAIEPPAALSDERWLRIFEILIPHVLGGMPRGLIGQAVRLMTHQARKFVARDPERARQTILETIRMTSAALELEPTEIFPDLAPKPKVQAGG